MTHSIQSLEQKLSKFVDETTEGRNESHGHSHMETVAQNAKTIMLHMDISRDQYKWALIVAWLHDVADHKYDKDGTLQTKLVEFVNSIEPDPIIANYLVQCVDMVSFSNETKGGYKYYEKILPAEWVVVRNIASDSDKLEALGFMGIKRCMQYAQEKSEEKLSDEQLLEYVWDHSQEKLLHLAKRFIHTENGRLLADPLHNIMIEWFKTQGINHLSLKKYV